MSQHLLYEEVSFENIKTIEKALLTPDTSVTGHVLEFCLKDNGKIKKLSM